MSKFKFFVLRDKFSRIAQIFLKFAMQMLNITEKFKNWKTPFKNSWKIGMHFGRWGWKIGTLACQVERLVHLWNIGSPSWTIGMPLARWHAKMNNWHAFSAFIETLARKNENLARFWLVDTLARGHVDHAGMHGTHGMRFSKL